MGGNRIQVRNARSSGLLFYEGTREGAPPAQQAANYVRGHDESEDSFHHLILEQDEAVEIGEGRPFQGGLSDINMHDVDPSELV